MNSFKKSNPQLAVNSAVYCEFVKIPEFTIVNSAVGCDFAESPEFTIVNSTASVCTPANISPLNGLDGGSWYSLITKKLAIYSLSLKFWLIH